MSFSALFKDEVAQVLARDVDLRLPGVLRRAQLARRLLVPGQWRASSSTSPDAQRLRIARMPHSPRAPKINGPIISKAKSTALEANVPACA